MDLEVKLFNPRRVVCEAVKITEENCRQVRLWVVSDQNTQSRIREETVGNWVVRRGDSRFEILTEGQLWTLYEPLVQKEWR